MLVSRRGFGYSCRFSDDGFFIGIGLSILLRYSSFIDVTVSNHIFIVHWLFIFRIIRFSITITRVFISCRCGVEMNVVCECKLHSWKGLGSEKPGRGSTGIWFLEMSFKGKVVSWKITSLEMKTFLCSMSYNL